MTIRDIFELIFMRYMKIDQNHMPNTKKEAQGCTYEARVTVTNLTPQSNHTYI